MFHRNNLPLSALNAFECAARTLHLGKAGEELGVTAGAVSHQIRHLEDRLGVSLFSRAHGRLSLTAAGERLHQSVREGLDTMARGAQLIDPQGLAGTLTIGCTLTIGASWLLRVIESFNEAHPEIEIFLEDIRPGATELPRQIDLAICYGRPTDRSRQVVPLAVSEVFPVCSPRYYNEIPAPQRGIQFEKLVLLHDPQNPWDVWFSACGIKPPQESRNIYFANTLMAMLAARMGLGVALCNTLETRDLIREGQLTRLVDFKVPEAESYFLVTSLPGQETLRAQLFAKYLTESLALDG